MRGIIFPAAVAAVLAASPFAFAANQAIGTIKAFDMKAHTLTLQDGTVYYLPSTFKDPGFAVGESVSVTWEMKGSKHEASAVTIQEIEE